MERLSRSGRAVLLLSTLFWAACGDTYRPVVIPNPTVPPDPQNTHFVFAVTTNAGDNPGAGMQIDVSGDSTLSVANVGRGPTFALLVPPGSSRLAVANTAEDTITNLVLANGIASNTPGTVTLASGSRPVFLASAESGIVYSANSGNNTVSVINASLNQVTQTISSAEFSNPVALAETPSNGSQQKVYVVNQGNNSVASINVVDKSVNPAITDPSIDVPVWAVARSDGQRVYVLSQGNGSLIVIDSNTNTLLSTSIFVGAGASYMAYDGRLNRLYITNPVAGTVSIFSVASDPPLLLATLDLNSTACSAGCTQMFAAPLPDGSRAYVASVLAGGSTVAPQISVIRTTDNTLEKTIALPSVTSLAACDAARFRVSISPSADSSRVYMANCDAGEISILRTIDDTLTVSLPAPVSAAAPPAGSTQPPPQNPIFIVEGP